MPKLETIRAKVGATVLDIFRPGWADEIDTDELDLASCSSCVLGQLFGDYEEGADTLFAIRRGEEDGVSGAAIAAGFSKDSEDHSIGWGNLTAAWKREIAKRAA